MPDQPADPLHYEMKIPPEPKHKESIDLQTQEQHRDSDEVTAESNDLDRTGASPEDARRNVPAGPPRQP
ncbi:MAG: hypothetical protein ACLGSD_14170 [Acidobacteriota bacterium]